ncbi:hypothetical protein BJX99DRAFT_244727 [Aspergillus californicus]
MSLMRAVAQFGEAFNVSVIDRPIPTILNATGVILPRRLRVPETPYLYGHEGIGHVEVRDAVKFRSVGDYVFIPDNIDNEHYSLSRILMSPRWALVARKMRGFLGYRIPFADNSPIPVPITDTTNTTTLIDYLSPRTSSLHAGAVIDQVPSRPALAASIGAIPVNFNKTDPVEEILALEPGGVRRGVGAVGYEAINSTGFDVGLAFGKSLSVDGSVVLPLEVAAAEIVPLITAGLAHPGFIVSSVIGVEDAAGYYRRFNEYLEMEVVIQF